MSDLRFACPTCSQHIACDPAWAGHKISCPTCQSQIVVPQPAAPKPAVPPPPPVRVSVGSALPPPAQSRPATVPPPPVPPPVSAAPRGALRVAAEPAHAAPAAAAAPPRGSETAKPNVIGQWLGLVSAVLVVAVIIGMAATWQPPARQFRGGLSDNSEEDDDSSSRRRRPRGKFARLREAAATADARREARDRAADEEEEETPTPVQLPPAALPQWTLDLQSAVIPAANATGQISGAEFTADRALLQRTAGGYALVVRQGKGFQPDREVLITLPLKAGEKLDGNAWTITSNSTGTVPRVAKRWTQNARQQTKLYTNGYAMKLEFDATTNGQLPGRLFLALPDEEKTFVAGTITASFLTTGAAPR